MTTIATLLKRFTLWKAQTGEATVAELEQYQASISLPSTLKMIVLLRAFSWTSVGLVLLWSWYYLGSQAVSREYTLQQSPKHKPANLVFINPEAPSPFHNTEPISPGELYQINAYFTSSFSKHVPWLHPPVCA
jgi:hypothetical protein